MTISQVVSLEYPKAKEFFEIMDKNVAMLDELPVGSLIEVPCPARASMIKQDDGTWLVTHIYAAYYLGEKPETAYIAATREIIDIQRKGGV